MSKYSDVQARREIDAIVVTAVTQGEAKGRTRYGSEVHVPWWANKPEPLPRVGESWLVERYNYNSWRFLSKMSTDGYGFMDVSMKVDARYCVGRERAVVGDVARSGVDGVVLVCAADGAVMWDSECAASLGLRTYGDHLTQLVNRFLDAGIHVTFAIDAGLWNDVDDLAQRPYQQVVVDPDTHGLAMSRLLSPWGAGGALGMLVDELYEKWGQDARGVAVDGLRLDGEGADYSTAAVGEWKRRYDRMPGRGFGRWDGTDEWWGRRAAWNALMADGFSDMRRRMSQNVGNWPVSAILSPYVWCVGDGTEKSGVLATGVPDSFARGGWSRVGFPMLCTMQADSAAEMRSFELLAAYTNRLAKGAQPWHVLRLSSLPPDQYGAAFEILGRYGCSGVLVEDYAKWRTLPDSDVLAIRDAIGAYKVYEKDTADKIGVLSSTSSVWCGRYDLDAIVRWHKTFENTCSEMLDALPHRLDVRFDEDLGDVSGLAALVLMDPQNMTDSGVEAVSQMKVPTVFVGDVGRYVGQSREERGRTPAESLFGLTYYGNADYTGELEVEAGEMDVEPVSFGLPVGMSAPVPSEGETDASGQVGGEEVAAPVKFSGRSSLVAFDPADDDMIAPIVGRAALYAVGRDA